MSWSRRFDEPIKTPDGKTLRALKDAANYVLSLPPDIQKEQHWQSAAECLRNAAEREIAWMWFARPAMMRALHGSDEPPVGNPEGKKGHRLDGLRFLAGPAGAHQVTAGGFLPLVEPPPCRGPFLLRNPFPSPALSGRIVSRRCCQ